MTTSPYGRGLCPACRREMNLTKDGKLRHHGGPTGSGYLQPRSYRCKGAGQAPATAGGEQR